MISTSKSTVHYESSLFEVRSHKEDLDISNEQDLDDPLNNLDQRSPTPSPPPIPAQIELEHVALNGSIGLVEPGDVVELHAPDVNGQDRPRGDFLLAGQIREELETGRMSFAGYRIRRTKHMAPMFNRRSYRYTHANKQLTNM